MSGSHKPKRSWRHRVCVPHPCNTVTEAGICETCVDQLTRRLRTERQEKSAEFGLMVRDARKARKLSQEALAKMVGLAQVQISRIEAGQAVPTREQALRIARCLKLASTPDAEPAAADPQPEPESKARPQRPAAAAALGYSVQVLQNKIKEHCAG